MELFRKNIKAAKPEMRGQLLISDQSYFYAYQAEPNPDGSLSVEDPKSVLAALRNTWAHLLGDSYGDLAYSFDRGRNAWVFFAGSLRMHMYVAFMISRVGPIIDRLPMHQMFQLSTPVCLHGPGTYLDWEINAYYAGLDTVTRGLGAEQLGDDVYFYYSESFVEEKLRILGEDGLD